MNSFINKYGLKTSEKLEKIILQACDYVDNTRGTWEFKNNTKKMQKLRDRFEKEAKRIGGINYNFGDCIA
jgi:hypothetical protein